MQIILKNVQIIFVFNTHTHCGMIAKVKRINTSITSHRTLCVCVCVCVCVHVCVCEMGTLFLKICLAFKYTMLYFKKFFIKVPKILYIYI